MATRNGVPFPQLCKVVGLPEPKPEYRFSATRKWRFDFAWPALKVALEVEGGAWTQGRHTRGAGFAADLEKYNAAQLAGWRVLRVLPDQLQATTTLVLLREALSV